jgi:GNAT superfamily N-acetyltransferase
MSAPIGTPTGGKANTDPSYWSANIRALGHGDAPSYAAHLTRLGQECRRARFGNYVSDDFLQAYVERIDPAHTLVIGCFDGAEMRGAVELRSLKAIWCAEAEIAFSAEKSWRGRGIGTALMFHAIAAARQLSVGMLYLSCHAFNRAMVRIAERAAASLVFSDCECEATITVHEDLSSEVANELSDVVIAFNLGQSGS